jgi:hypothetical protein
VEGATHALGLWRGMGGFGIVQSPDGWGHPCVLPLLSLVWADGLLRNQDSGKYPQSPVLKTWGTVFLPKMSGI